MDNTTYDAACPTPVNTDEMYSRLRALQTNTNPTSEFQGRADIGQNAMTGIQQNNSKHSSNNIKFTIVIINTIVILLLLTITSIAMSVTNFNRLASVETQFITVQSNMSLNLNQLDDKLEMFILLLTQNPKAQTQTNCGPGLWYPVILLNMNDPTQRCPFAWREYNTNRVRACGRPTNSSGSCATILWSSNRQYSRVCGRVIGYQYASPNAFRPLENSNSIDLDGINITRGTNHSHIWSYVAGYSTTPIHHSNCPCSNNGQGFDPPSSIGDSYYCESGNPNSVHTATLYTDDPLWDGKQCEGTCCTGTNSPPWFSVQLPVLTTDAIEVSICCDQETNDEDVPVELIEIYVQ